jgi:mono/diheme cytochrome c family protein
MLIAIAIGLAVAGFAAAIPVHARTYANARAVGKRCSTCHTTHRPNASNLNAAGRWFMRHRTLDGFTPAKAAAEERDGPGSVPLGPADTQAPVELQPGSRVFNGICVHCHGAGGAGTPQARPLNVSGVYGDTPEQIAEVIRTGIQGTAMQPFKGALTDEQISGVAKYVAWLRR